MMLRIAAVADQAADKKMRAVIELYAPWAEDAERAWLDELQNDDSRRVWLGGKELGERLRLTNAERESLKVWRIAPVNLDGELISAEDLADSGRRRSETGRGSDGSGPAPFHAKPIWQTQNKSSRLNSECEAQAQISYQKFGRVSTVST